MIKALFFLVAIFSSAVPGTVSNSTMTAPVAATMPAVPGIVSNSTMTAPVAATMPGTTDFAMTNPPNFTTPNASCGGYLMASSFPQYFNSPNHPKNYSNYQYCEWTIRAPPGYRVRVNLFNFETESCCDFLDIIENGTLCFRRGGSVGSDYFVSASDYITVVFSADFSTTGKGFNASYYYTDEPPSKISTPTPPTNVTGSFNFTTPVFTTPFPTSSPNNTNGNNTFPPTCPSTTHCNRRAAWLCEYISWKLEFLVEWQTTFEQWRSQFPSLPSFHHSCYPLYVQCVHPHQQRYAYDMYHCYMPYCADGLYQDISQSNFQHWIDDQMLWRRAYRVWREAFRYIRDQSGSGC